MGGTAVARELARDSLHLLPGDRQVAGRCDFRDVGTPQSANPREWLWRAGAPGQLSGAHSKTETLWPGKGSGPPGVKARRQTRTCSGQSLREGPAPVLPHPPPLVPTASGLPPPQVCPSRRPAVTSGLRSVPRQPNFGPGSVPARGLLRHPRRAPPLPRPPPPPPS